MSAVSMRSERSNVSVVKFKIAACDVTIIEEAVSVLKNLIQDLGLGVSEFSGPFPLPRKRKHFVVLTSPHIYKKAREHFELRIHYRYFELRCNPESFSKLQSYKLNLPPGVEIKMSVANQNKASGSV